VTEHPEITPDREEATQRAMHLARLQGDAYAQAAAHLLSEASGLGAECRVGGYRIGYVARVEAGTDPPGGGCEHGDIEAGMVSLGVIVRDAADGRFVPGLQVVVTILAANGSELGCHTHPLLWHPVVHQYARDWALPRVVPLRVRVSIVSTPHVQRSRIYADRLADSVEIEFSDVIIPAAEH
jgi:hypothetical protein